MPLSALQYRLHPAAERFESGTIRGDQTLKKVVSASAATLLLLSGCGLFLPDGKAPEGAIVTNPGSIITELVLDRRKALDYFIDELIRETMLHCPGSEIFVDADAKSTEAAIYIVRRTGELSGVSHAVNPLNAPRLVSRFAGNNWQMELISGNGKSLWKRTVSLKPAAI